MTFQEFSDKIKKVLDECPQIRNIPLHKIEANIIHENEGIISVLLKGYEKENLFTVVIDWKH